MFLEAVLGNAWSIVAHAEQDGIVTFFAEDDRLDSQRELDARHRARVTAIRKRFKENFVRAVPAALPGWTSSLLGTLTGNVPSILWDRGGA